MTRAARLFFVVLVAGAVPLSAKQAPIDYPAGAFSDTNEAVPAAGNDSSGQSTVMQDIETKIKNGETPTDDELTMFFHEKTSEILEAIDNAENSDIPSVQRLQQKQSLQPLVDQWKDQLKQCEGEEKCHEQIRADLRRLIAKAEEFIAK